MAKTCTVEHFNTDISGGDASIYRQDIINSNHCLYCHCRIKSHISSAERFNSLRFVLMLNYFNHLKCLMGPCWLCADVWMYVPFFVVGCVFFLSVQFHLVLSRPKISTGWMFYMVDIWVLLTIPRFGQELDATALLPIQYWTDSGSCHQSKDNNGFATVLNNERRWRRSVHLYLCHWYKYVYYLNLNASLHGADKHGLYFSIMVFSDSLQPLGRAQVSLDLFHHHRDYIHSFIFKCSF